MKNAELSAFLFISCMAAGLGCDQLEIQPDASAQAKERWNRSNAPTRFQGVALRYALDDLPTEGRAQREIWPSTYWATQDDSINVRWASGELSPAEKYDKAFNGWVPDEGFLSLRPYQRGENCADYDAEYYSKLGPLASHISGRMGNRKARDGLDNDGDGQIDECDDRDGVQSWFGLCHAWVPAAMLEDRPLRTIEYNGVTFHPGDLEALIITAYNRAGADVIGQRCNDKGTEIERDEQGRPTSSKCRDTNPGTMHVIMTNYLGLNQLAFAEDRTYDYEVWNQPVVGYEVKAMNEITLAEANEKLGLTGDAYTPNRQARFFYDVRASLTYITESHASRQPAESSEYEREDEYTYILELDANRKIIGGEWYGDSLRDHPDFLWSPRRAWQSSVPYLDLATVRMLISLSREADPSADTPPVGGDPLEYEVLPDVAIPDNDEGGVAIEVVIPSGVSGHLSVSTVFSHEDLSQVKVGLIGPTGESWEIVPGRTAVGSAYFETTVELDPQPVGELSGVWKLVVIDFEPEKTGLVEQFKLTVLPE